MDIRIGNDIRIDITLDGYTKSETCYIKEIVSTLKNVDIPQFCPPNEREANECGVPTYNVMPIDPGVHHCHHDNVPWVFRFKKPEYKEVDSEYIEKFKHCQCNQPKTQFDEQNNIIRILFDAKDLKIIGNYALEVCIVLYDKAWNKDGLHTVLLDFGTLFNLVEEGGEDGGTIIQLDGTLNLAEYISQRGEDGEDAIDVKMFTNFGNILIGANESCTMYAEIWKGSEDITDKIPSFYISWTRRSGNDVEDLKWNKKHMNVGPSITISANDISKKAMYQCEFDYESYKQNN